MARHNERYPTHHTTLRKFRCLCQHDSYHLYNKTLTKKDMVALHNRLRTLDINLQQGDLSFFKNWTFFMPENYTSQIGQLIPTGPFAGTLGAYQAGITLRTRYPHLRSTALANNKTNFWAADSPRVIETAKIFASAFFGQAWEQDGEDRATLHVMAETSDLGADTLTTGNTCKNYDNNSTNQGRQKGSRKLKEWLNIYLPPITSRLNNRNPGLALSDHETFTMQELCAFDLLVRGPSSPWCSIFSQQEWESFEYARDLLHFYRAGPGNRYSAARGFLWLNATTNLLVAGPSAKTSGSLFFSFVHHGDILPLLSTLDLFSFPSSSSSTNTTTTTTTTTTNDLPTDKIPTNRSWKTSTLVPMGSRIILERMTCPRVYCHSNAPLYPNHVYCNPPHDESYIRILINDGLVPIPDCKSGPGESCPLRDFERRVLLRGWEVGDFGRLCGLQKGAADRITFLHQ
jgi:acid phosphatase